MRRKSLHIIKSSLALLALAFVLGSCSSESEIIVPEVTFENIEPLFNQKTDTVYVINFWATWCKPCITELPEFEKINREFRKKPVRVILISLDFPAKHQSDLIPFLKKNNINSEVLHLIDTDANRWIDKVSPLWSGAIPATVIYKKNKREFYERSMTYDELKLIITTKLDEI